MYEKGPETRLSPGSSCRDKLPEFLTPAEVAGLLALTKRPRRRLMILMLWRAGLRVSEALALKPADITTSGNQPVLRVRQRNGGVRFVPIHSELQVALEAAAEWGVSPKGRIISAHRGTVWRWIRLATDRAVRSGVIGPERHVSASTFRHSAAVHWLSSGIPLNVVSSWLGLSIQATLPYLQYLPHELGSMSRVA